MGTGISTNRIENVKKTPSPSSLISAPIFPTSPINVDVENLETFLLVWLDPYIDDDEENQLLQTRLRTYMTYLVTFDSSILCEQWLKTRPSTDKILLIISGALGKRILPNIHQLPSIIAIYIFCLEPKNHIEWSQNYSKVRSVISKETELVQKISNDQLHFENIELFQSIEIFINLQNTRILNRESASFIWYQLFLKILLSSSYFQSSPSRIELVDSLRRCTSQDKEGLNLINQFDQTYQKTQAIHFLRTNTALARFTYRALREQNISMLFHLRFFLIDIQNQLKDHQLQSIHVYRRQLITLQVLNNIQRHLGEYFTLNGFLFTSTTIPSEVSDLDQKNNQFESVLIEIDAVYRNGVVPFASVEQITQDTPNESQTILFMCASIFRIISLRRTNNSTWILQLTLVSSEELNLLNENQLRLRQNKDFFLINDLLNLADQSMKNTIYCKSLLRYLPSDSIQIPYFKERLEINRTIQPVSLHSAQFIFTDISMDLSELASSMLNTLHSLTNNSIMIWTNKNSQIDFESMSNKTILLFTNNQFISSITKKPSQLMKLFILEEKKNSDRIDQKERFGNSEDLIFQMCDELERYYKWEANDHLRNGDTPLAKAKEQIANEIPIQLKRVHQKSLLTSKQVTLKTTSIVWLCHEKHHVIKMKDRIKDVIPLFSIFVNEQKCFSHLCTTAYDHIVFLIIDNEYEERFVHGFQNLSNVKKVYRYDQPSTTINDYDDLSFQLIHDLITHLNKLAIEQKDRKDFQTAKDMFLKAKKLSEVLIEL